MSTKSLRGHLAASQCAAVQGGALPVETQKDQKEFMSRIACLWPLAVFVQKAGGCSTKFYLWQSLAFLVPK